MAYDSDDGHFHLTPSGWVRQDDEPFPADRIETWHYSMHQASGWSREHRTLSCVWVSPNISRAERDLVREQFEAPYGFGERSRQYTGGMGEPL